MRINSSGNVGIGTSSPAKALDVEGAIRSNITGGTSPAEIDISSGSTWRLRSNATSGTNAYGMDIVKGSAGTDVKLSVDSSGNLLVGKTSLGISNAGHTLAADGYTEFTRTATSTSTGGTINVGRNSYDGPLATFWKDGSTVGTIGTNIGHMYLGTDDVGLRFSHTGDYIYPVTANGGTGRDNAIGLGYNGSRFKDLYLSGGIYLGGTGSANKLEDYEEGTYTPVFDPTSGSATASSVYGSYTKVGDLVQVQLRFSGIIISGSPSGYLRVTLPFTCATGVSSVAVSAYNMNSAMNAPNTEIIHNNNRMYLFGFNNGTRIDHTAGLLNTGGQLIFGGTYRTS